MLCSTRGNEPHPASPNSVSDHPHSAFPTPPGHQSPATPLGTASSTQDNQDFGVILHENAAADAQALLDFYNGINPIEGIPSFFEQIMIPDPNVICSDPTQPPPTLTTWMPDIDWFGDADLFGTEFAPAVDQNFETQQVLNDFFSTTAAQDGTGADTNEVPNTALQDDSARKRHAIFQRSPW